MADENIASYLELDKIATIIAHALIKTQDEF